MSHATQLLVTNDVVTPARTLRATAVYLARHGWVQGCLYDPSATVFTPAACWVGALGMVCYGGPVDAPAVNYEDPGYGDFVAAQQFLQKYLKATRGDEGLYSFNDVRGRTREEIIAVLNEAADQWERSRSLLRHGPFVSAVTSSLGGAA